MTNSHAMTGRPALTGRPVLTGHRLVAGSLLFFLVLCAAPVAGAQEGSAPQKSAGALSFDDFLERRGALLARFETLFIEEPSDPAPAPEAAPAASTADPLPTAAAIPQAAQEGPPWTRAALLARSLVENPALAAAKARSRAAQADLSAARGRRLPLVSAEGGARFTGNPIGPITLTRGELGSIDTGTGTVLLPATDTVIYKGMEETWYNFALKGEVPLFTWGKISRGIELAGAALEVARLKTYSDERETLATIQGALDSLYCLREVRRILQFQSAISSRMLALATASEDAGFLTASELSKTRIRLKELELELLRLDDRISSLLDRLARAAALPGLSLDELVLDPVAPEPAPQELAEALTGIPAGSHSLALARLGREAREKALALAQTTARGLPDIGLQFELSYGGPRFPFIETDWYRKDDWQLNLSLGTSGTIFGSAASKAALERARAELAEADAVEQDARRQLLSWIRERYLTMDLLLEKLSWARLDQDARGGDLERQALQLRAGSGSEITALTELLESLVPLAQAWGDLAQYRGEIRALEAAKAD